MTAKDLFDDVLQDLLPEGDGRFNLGEVLLFGFTIVLALFTAFRSYDFIKHTLPPGWELVAYVGLAVLDGGFIVWALVIALSATSPVQVAIAWSMWLLDALGLTLITVADSFFYIQAAESTAAMADTVSAMAAWAFPILAVVNAAFAILYKMMAPHRIRERQRRQQMEALRHITELGSLKARIEHAKAAVASQLTDQRMSMADMKAALARQLAELERLEKQLRLERIRQAQLHDKGRAGSLTVPVPQGEIMGGGSADNGNNHHPSQFTTNSAYTGLDVEDE